MSEEHKITAVTVVYERLRSDIIHGVLLPAQRLHIEQMAEHYGVGVNPMREALNRLSGEEFVEHREQRGFHVRPVTLNEFRQLQRTRCWLDCKALEESIAQRTPQWEDALRSMHQRLEQTPERVEDSDAPRAAQWEKLHCDFHHALVANAGSVWLTRFCDELMNQAERYRFLADTQTQSKRNTPDEHRQIMEAAVAGDAAQASACLREHYMRTLGLLEERFGSADEIVVKGIHVSKD